jgi:nitrogen fixation/metabolism regulation signal transduction histidine kinase
MSKDKKGWRRRRKYIVNPRYQLQFAAVLVLLQVNVGLLFLGVLSHKFTAMAENAGSLEIFLATDLWRASLPVMALTSFAASIAVAWLGIRYSNQIVGPIPRITRAMRELAHGNTKQRLVFRPGDVLEELADEFNVMCAALDQGIPLGEDVAKSDVEEVPSEESENQAEPIGA